MASSLGLATLTRIRCSIFQTSYNPTSVRTGAKYLRRRLRGPAMVDYYPPVVDIAKVMREAPELGIVNMKEQQRLTDLEKRKARGKGPPKKARTAAEGRRKNRKQ